MTTWFGPAGACLVLTLWLLAPGSMSAGWATLWNVPTVDGEATEDPAATLVLRNLKLTVTPPVHTGRRPLELHGAAGDFRAFAGSAVRLDGDVPTPSSTAQLRWEGGADRFEGTARGGALELDFLVPAGGGRYRVEVPRTLGREPLYTRWFRVKELPDLPPELEVAGPPDRSVLDPHDSVVLSVRSADDFGLSRLDLVVRGERGEVTRQPIPEAASRTQWTGEVLWNPQGLGASVGELELLVEAWDNDTVSGPKVTRSRPLTIDVPTERDHHTRVLALKDRLLDLSLDLLAELLVSNQWSPGAVRRAAVLKAFEHHNSLAGGFFTAGDELRAAMLSDRWERREVFLGVLQAIDNLVARWEDVVEVVQAQIEPDRRAEVSARTLQSLWGARERMIEELERVVLDLAAFADLQRGDEALSALVDLEPELASLSDLMRQAEAGQAVEPQLQSALDRLQQRLAELAALMAQRRPGPEDGFANQVPGELGEDIVSEVRRLLSEGKHSEAMERIQEAMDGLAELSESLQAQAEAMAGGVDAERLGQQLDTSIAQTQELESRQRQVVSATERLQQQVGTGEALNEAGSASLVAEMDLLRRMIDALPGPGLEGRTRAVVRQWTRLASELSSDMKAAFAGGDIERAADLGDGAADYLDEVDSSLDEESGPTLERIRVVREEVAAASNLGRDLARRLRRLQEQTSAARQRAAEAGQPLAEQQRSVLQGVQAVQEQIEQMGGSSYNPVDGRDNLQTASELMGRAANRLDQGRPAPALASEKDALGQLTAFRESLQAARKAMEQGQRMGSSGQGASAGGRQHRAMHNDQGRDDRTGRVEMTDPDDFVSPEAFRALIQDEAGREAPKRYKPLNRSYYEELVR